MSEVIQKDREGQQKEYSIDYKYETSVMCFGKRKLLLKKFLTESQATEKDGSGAEARTFLKESRFKESEADNIIITVKKKFS